ncbi:MAG: hypothetical protein IKR48_06735 [Kiritimatiellae bacterium]|nr:hypothetical protein [Kiritimatiellia bacterium]
MIPDLQTSLLCDDVRQERSGKFILIGIFDGLALNVQNPVCPRICLINRWCMGEGDFQQESRIVAPDGVSVVCKGHPVPMKLKNEIQISTTVEVFINLPFKQEGTHWVEILLDGQLKMRYPLTVRLIQPQQPQPPSQA